MSSGRIGVPSGLLTLRSVATDTCGQLSPLKFSSTVWVYCSWRYSSPPLAGTTFSIQNIAVMEAGEAFGPSVGEPCKNAVPSVPPPLIGEGAVVDMMSAVVVMTMSEDRSDVRTEFGSSTMACVIDGSDKLRNGVAVPRFDSGNGTVLEGFPTTNGVML